MIFSSFRHGKMFEKKSGGKNPHYLDTCIMYFQADAPFYLIESRTKFLSDVLVLLLTVPLRFEECHVRPHQMLSLTVQILPTRRRMPNPELEADVMIYSALLHTINRF